MSVWVGGGHVAWRIFCTMSSLPRPPVCVDVHVHMHELKRLIVYLRRPPNGPAEITTSDSHALPVFSMSTQWT